MQPRIVKNADFAPGQLDSFTGKTGLMAIDGLNSFQFEVRVIGARVRFGHLDFLVAPVSGSGERWIEAHRVDLDSASPF
jgi:hypothetical protein